MRGPVARLRIAPRELRRALRRNSAAAWGTLALVVGASAGLVTPAALAGKRYAGYVTCGESPTHQCGLGSYAPFATFRAKQASNVRYKLCVLHKRTGRRQCVHRTARAGGAKSSVAIFLLARFRGAAYNRSGRYVATWFVHGKRVAKWRLDVAEEQEG